MIPFLRIGRWYQGPEVSSEVKGNSSAPPDLAKSGHIQDMFAIDIKMKGA